MRGIRYSTRPFTPHNFKVVTVSTVNYVYTFFSCGDVTFFSGILYNRLGNSTNVENTIVVLDCVLTS